jgi:hypothetical protein
MLIENPLNSSELSFPIIECFHIAGFIVGIGSAALVDFRLLGIGLRRQTPEQLTRDTSLWTLAGLTVAIFAGLLLYSTDPDKYYLNTPFVVKSACLVLAIVFHYTIHRKVALSGASPAGNRLAALVSLSLWVSVVVGGLVVSFTAV